MNTNKRKSLFPLLLITICLLLLSGCNHMASDLPGYQGICLLLFFGGIVLALAGVKAYSAPGLFMVAIGGIATIIGFFGLILTFLVIPWITGFF